MAEDIKDTPTQNAPGQEKNMALQSPSLPKEHDVVLLHSPTKDGKGINALRSRNGEMALAELRPMEIGKPIPNNQIVSLHKRVGSPVLWDVKVEYDTQEASNKDHVGPSRVASNTYRKNWEVIFGDPEEDTPTAVRGFGPTSSSDGTVN